MIRIGSGYDVHKLVEGRKLIIGGVDIPHTMGLLGHSDADVLIHAICDALLGAANLRDIGYNFPDNAEEYKQEYDNINSDNQEFIEELNKRGVDPMFYFAEEIKQTFKRDILDFRLIGGNRWNDEVVLDVIRKQIRNSNTGR